MCFLSLSQTIAHHSFLPITLSFCLAHTSSIIFISLPTSFYSFYILRSFAFNSLSFTFIHFHSLFIHFHSLFIHFHHFHSISFTFILFAPFLTPKPLFIQPQRLDRKQKPIARVLNSTQMVEHTLDSIVPPLTARLLFAHNKLNTTSDRLLLRIVC